MSSDSFRFKQFAVRQVRSAMKVGTDGVLIAAWAGIDGHEQRILDLGTGTGLIALMIAQRCPEAIIDAVEIEPGAAAEAIENVEASPWSSRIHIFQEPFQTFATRSQDQGEKYDLIISNPPYFNGTYKSVQAERTAARHVELLKNDDIIDGVLKIIEPDKGRFVAIFPYETGAVFIAKAATKGLFCSRLGNIYPKQGQYIKRIVTEFSLTPGFLIEENIAIENATGYTQEYVDLTKDFYLKF